MLNRFQRSLQAPFPTLAVRTIKARGSAQETLWHNVPSGEKWRLELRRTAASLGTTWRSAFDGAR